MILNCALDMYMSCSDFLDMWLGFLFRSRNLVGGVRSDFVIIYRDI